MGTHGVRRLVVQSSFGVGETRGRLRLQERLFFSLLLKPQIVDTEVQELVAEITFGCSGRGVHRGMCARAVRAT